MTEQEKKAAEEKVNQDRLVAFDAGVEACVEASGLDKEAAAKMAGKKDFKEFQEWALNVASAAAEAEAESQK